MARRISIQLRIWQCTTRRPAQLEEFTSIEAFVEWWNTNLETHGVQLALEVEEVDPAQVARLLALGSD
jgi:hypothetical protein